MSYTEEVYAMAVDALQRLSPHDRRSAIIEASKPTVDKTPKPIEGNVIPFPVSEAREVEL